MENFLRELFEKLIQDVDTVRAGIRSDIVALIAQIEELQRQLTARHIDELAADKLRAEIVRLRDLYLGGSNPQAERIIFFTGGQEITNMFLKVTQKLPLNIAIKDKARNPAAVDGKPTWALSDESLGTLAVSEDGLSADLTPAGPVGSCKVQVSVDADLGEGVKNVLGELPVDFIAGEAVTVEISAGEPSDI